MIALIVEINIKPGFKDQFMASMLGDARGSNNDEPGCLRFDVLQDNEDENKIHLFEVYEDDAAVDAHRKRAAFHQVAGRMRRLVRHREHPQDCNTGVSRARKVGKAPSGRLSARNGELRKTKGATAVSAPFSFGWELAGRLVRSGVSAPDETPARRRPTSTSPRAMGRCAHQIRSQQKPLVQHPQKHPLRQGLVGGCDVSIVVDRLVGEVDSKQRADAGNHNRPFQFRTDPS